MNKREAKEKCEVIYGFCHTRQVQKAASSLVHIFLTLKFSVMCAT